MVPRDLPEWLVNEPKLPVELEVQLAIRLLPSAAYLMVVFLFVEGL